ncbi:MAG: phosphomannomutase/phosphoglucomutase [Phycisphaerales bacterium]|nr:phosphomannomutase/phosphoglucomutase [Phycisphaerales bacterium]
MLGKVFKAYDVRAIVPKPLNTRLAWQIGHGAARYLVESAQEAGFDDPMMRHLAVGRDPRPTSPELGEALMAGIRAAGVSVIDLGVCDTPMIYFAVNHLACAGGIQVTASHNPVEYNGFKFCGIGARPVGSGSGLETIRELAALADPDRAQGTDEGRYETRDLWDAYARRLHGLLAEEAPEGLAATRGRPLKVVVDASNGSAGIMCPRLFDGLEGLEIVPINFTCGDGHYEHEPNPLVEENLDQLRAAVRDNQADLGVCFDGDADRCVVVDEAGRTVGGDLLTAWLVEPILERSPGTAVIFDLRSSRIVPERITSLGGKPVPSRVGHVFMKAALAEHEAAFGGELSGHFYYRDMFGADSGSRAFVSVLGALARSDAPMSEQVGRLRVYAQSGEVNFKNEDIEGTLASLRDVYSDAEFGEMDGLSIDTGGWWANIRASNTEPLLRLNVEAADQAAVDAALEELGARLGTRVAH